MHVIYGCQSLDSLRAAIAEKAVAAITESPPEGQFVGASMIESVLNSVRQYFPDGSKIKIGWQRVGGRSALLVSGSHGLVDILGTSGRISVEAQGLSEIPISKLGFGYRIQAGKIAIKLDEIEFDLPGADTASASGEVGNPLLIAWTILGAIKNVYDVFHPTIDVYLSEDIAITATIGQTCLIRFDRGEPAIRAHWAFFMGLLRVEYSRPLTGLTICANEIVFEFHKSRIYRDVKFPIKN
jgi:hypothetical protein